MAQAALLFLMLESCCEEGETQSMAYTLETELPIAPTKTLALRLFELSDGSVLFAEVTFDYWDVMHKRWYVGVRAFAHGKHTEETMRRFDQALKSFGWKEYPPADGE